MARRPTYDPGDYYEPPPTERCGMTGKIIYHSAAVANGAAKQVKLDYGAEVRPYRDPACSHWHLTRSG